ncbi:hypothetical protein NL676_018577 [Syzygium grande]|nr:hypothetical protein NL676_018577 [Syzygium grande]
MRGLERNHVRREAAPILWKDERRKSRGSELKRVRVRNPNEDEDRGCRLKRSAPPPRTSRTAVDEDRGRAEADAELSEERRESRRVVSVGSGRESAMEEQPSEENLGRNSESYGF